MYLHIRSKTKLFKNIKSKHIDLSKNIDIFIFIFFIFRYIQIYYQLNDRHAVYIYGLSSTVHVKSFKFASLLLVEHKSKSLFIVNPFIHIDNNDSHMKGI